MTHVLTDIEDGIATLTLNMPALHNPISDLSMVDALVQALACGLVSRVVPDAQLLPEARRLAARIAANPALAVQQTKRLLLQGRQGALAPLLEAAAAVQALLHTTDEHRAAVEAFSKRRPK